MVWEPSSRGPGDGGQCDSQGGRGPGPPTPESSQAALFLPVFHMGIFLFDFIRNGELVPFQESGKLSK